MHSTATHPQPLKSQRIIIQSRVIFLDVPHYISRLEQAQPNNNGRLPAVSFAFVAILVRYRTRSTFHSLASVEFQRMNPLESHELSLRNPPSKHLRKEIIHRLWRRAKDEIDLDDYDSYFDHYDETCRTLYLGARCEADSMSASTHEHVLLIIDGIWSFIDQDTCIDRALLRESLSRVSQSKTQFHNQADERINPSIDLALRLWLTMNIRKRGVTPIIRNNPWNDQTDLTSFIRTQFRGPEIARDINAPLVGALTAVDMERTSGIRIKWTYHLEDHLLLDRVNRTLNVYPLERVLHDHMMRFVSDPNSLTPGNVLTRICPAKPISYLRHLSRRHCSH